MRPNWILLTGLIVFSQAIGNPPQKPYNRTRTPFINGEELVYRLHYGFINGGNATITIKDRTLDKKPTYHARVYAVTTGLTKTLFPVEDSYESYFDRETGLPYKAIRNISEGGYRFYNEVTFSHADTSVFSQKSGKHKVPHGTLDMVSSLYYLRNLDIDTLRHGDVINFTTYFSDEIFPFLLRYKGIETVKTEFGSVRCYRFDPVVEPGRIFKSEDDMSFWLTADENRVPVLIEFDLIVGSVKCELVEYKNLKRSIRWN